MIQNIEKKITGDKLEIRVTCHIKRFAKNPIILLTTDSLIAILNKEHKILEVLEEPSYKVGNLNMKKVNNVGEWVFKLGKKKQSTRGPSKKKTTVNTPKEKPTPSIRSRISNIAKK